MPQKITMSPEEFATWRPVAAAPAAGTGAETAPDSGGMIEHALQHLLNIGIGAGKGALSTARTFSEGTKGAETFGDPLVKWGDKHELDATGAMQSIGKGAEQVGEFFIPANMARQAAIRGLVTLIPDAASPGTMKVLNKAGAIIGRSLGEAVSAGGVAKAHGDSAVGDEMLMGALGPLAGSAGGALLDNPVARDFLAALSAGNLTGKIPTSFGGRMGMYGLTKGAIAQGLAKGPKAAQKVGTAAGRLAAGASDTIDNGTGRR